MITSHDTHDTIGDLMLRLSLDYLADIVSLSRIGNPPDRFRHVMLSHYSTSLETFDMPRDLPSFCSIVLETGKPFVMPSLSRHCGIEDCPLMRAEGFDSYIGAPVMGPGGPIAALQLMAHESRDWTVQDITKLESYARAVPPLLHTPAVISTQARRRPLRVH